MWSFAGVLLAVLIVAGPAGAVLAGTNGRILFTSGRDSANGDDNEAKLFLRTVIGSAGLGLASPTLTPSGGQHKHATWSPDRTKIVYARGTPGSPMTENFDIYIQDLTTGAGTIFSVHWGQKTPPRDYRETLKSDLASYTKFRLAMLEAGVLLLPDARWYVGAVHGDAELELVTSAIDKVLS